ncbi:S8 family serine peptidase [Streptomyces pratens]|uniref:S8 family serine peptidase n=1 Tax=Streptomyces pratens TaxID=887456 RepID=A0ABW1LS63_9ACTN
MSLRRLRLHATAAGTAMALAATVTPSHAADALTSGGGLAARAPGAASVTLITGDRVTLDADGDITAVVRAKGRENIPIRVYRQDEATMVVPLDAHGLIEDGTVDAGLFDVTELSRREYRAVDGLPMIVSYEGDSKPVAKALRRDEDVRIRAEFNTVRAEALTARQGHGVSLWKTLTDRKRASDGGMSLETAPGVRAVSLDRVKQLTLDESLRQVGADAARRAGLDGSGTRIAILDSGIDAGHGDFGDGRILASADFTEEGDKDTVGHGTHVASTAAGSGARSGGTYRGVAPGADLMVGKVIGEYGGLTSWIIEGMEWAVGQGADIVNMSLGGPASTGHDPLVETVDQLSRDSGTLFVVAAGNEGPTRGTVGSPGVAASALTVGAVDGKDAVASFSSVGPGLPGGALKPDLSAPGVQIAAASAAGSEMDLLGTPVADGYVAIDGTSMAAPHVAGAAALLLQKHPDWTGEQLKRALVGSAEGIDATPVQTGTGRLDIPRALAQTVTADSGTLNFGTVTSPQAGAAPVTKSITYRNSGTADVTLRLDARTTSANGGRAPEGLFSLGASSVTVPARGSATAEVTAHPAALAGAKAGDHGIVVTAKAGEIQVRTAGNLAVEAERVDVTLEITGSDGEPAQGARAFVIGEPDGFNAVSKDGVITGSVERGDHFIEVLSPDPWEPGGDEVRIDWAVAPRLTVDGPTTVKVDLRKGRKLDFTAPDPDASLEEMAASFDSDLSGWSWYFGAPEGGVHTHAIAGSAADTSLRLSVGTFHADSDGGRYYGYRETRDTFPTGLVNNPGREDMAQVTAVTGLSTERAEGWLAAAPEGAGLSMGAAVSLPGETGVWLQSGTPWTLTSSQYDADESLVQISQTPDEVFAPGKHHERTLNVGVFGPALFGEDPAFLLEGNLLIGQFAMFAPGTSAGGWAHADEARTRVYRNGTLVRDLPVPMNELAFGIADGRAEYRIVSSASRAGLDYTSVSREVTVDYTFAVEPGGEEMKPVTGPLAVRFSPDLATDNTAPAGRKRFRVPMAVQGGTAASLTIETSVDGGTRWTTVHKGAGNIAEVAVRTPDAGGSVSLRATAVDTAGNRSVQTILDAFRTR